MGMGRESHDADVIVVGSGFGGAVTALRLAEAGHRVLVLERGRDLADDDLHRARRDPRAYLWEPSAGMRGFFWLRVLRHVAVIGGSGVGGGSIVWAGVLLEPRPDFYARPELRRLGVDWASELREPLERAARMLGRATSRAMAEMDENLRATAVAMGRGHTFGPVPVAIHHGRPGETVPDPFFGGLGPDRTGCIQCGECLLGCPYGAKNQLTRNYLHLARHHGVRILAEHDVVSIAESEAGGYVLRTRHPWRGGESRAFTAPQVVLAAGVLGTVELLLRCRDEVQTLPSLSGTLGHHIRTNSEAITAVLGPPGTDLSTGPTITSDFHPDERTHTTQNRYMGGWHMRAQVGPFVDDEQPGRRARRVLHRLATHPVRQVRTMFAPQFLRRLTVFTTMQEHDSELSLHLGRSPLRPWRRVVATRLTSGQRPPSNIALANRVTEEYARVAGGEPLNLLGESIGGLSVTAHVLGGAVMGRNSAEGVVNADHEVHGYPGLHVVDASVIPANLGVNPSLTITALAERFAERFVERHRGTRVPKVSEPLVATPVSRQTAEEAEAVRAYREAALVRAEEEGNEVSRTLVGLRRTWSALATPELSALDGDHEASFVKPLGRIAPAGLGLVGLPRWYGKRFVTSADPLVEPRGVNLLRASGGGLEETMPMIVRAGISKIDGLPAVIVEYGPEARKPWPWVRDELRVLEDGVLLGMTVVDLPGLRSTGGTPFLLTARRAQDGRGSLAD